MDIKGLLIAKVLLSPHAHARIKSIDATKARALPGVAAVLTYHDIPRVAFSTAGQSDPIPGPLDTFSLDNKVRFVGDRVAFVAAETEAIANEALKLIEVEYELLPLLLDPKQAIDPSATILHDETEYVNLVNQIHGVTWQPRFGSISETLNKDSLKRIKSSRRLRRPEGPTSLN